MSSDSPHVPDLGQRGDEDDYFGLNVVLDLLADRRRRYVLYHLREEEETSVDDIADSIARWEDRSGQPVRQRVETELHHKHLPRLAETGVVERGDGTVRLGKTNERLEAFLNLAAERERPL